jgi:hypothetical protein
MIEVVGDSARGEELAFVRLTVDGDRIVEADAPGLARPLAGLTLLEAAAVPGETLAADALANALAEVFTAAPDPGRIAVAMSGGVDSAVALLRAGPRAIGVTLRLWLDPVRPSIGPLGLFRLRDVNAPPDTAPLPPGRYDDLDTRIRYTGSWHPDLQFPDSSAASLTYSDTPGAMFSVSFKGRGITYVFTQAANRGIAEVTMDGGHKVRFSQYSGVTSWQSTRRFDGLKRGVHTLEVRVSGEKDPLSNGLFVDLDALVVEP